MPSFAKCAALVAGLLGSTAIASPHGHLARAIHQKKDIVSDVAVAPGLFREGVLEGLNKKTGAIAMDNDEGAYVVQIFNNNTEKDIDIVVWSSTGQEGSFSAMTINVTPANITTTIPAGGNTSISFNPALYTVENGFPGAKQSISGALCAMTNETAPSPFGGCSETWFEYTFIHDADWSTMDISRLPMMNGTPMTAISYPEKGAKQACVSDMETCVYTCPNGEASCLVAATDKPCNGNTGCMGYGRTAGYTALYVG